MHRVDFFVMNFFHFKAATCKHCVYGDWSLIQFAFYQLPFLKVDSEQNSNGWQQTNIRFFEDLTDELESVSPPLLSETTFYAYGDEKVDIKFMN